MITCECDEGECRHPGTHNCENRSQERLRTIQQQPRIIDSQILQQQQQQLRKPSTEPVTPHQAESGETFGDEDESFGF